MDAELAAYLSQHRAVARGAALWLGGLLPLTITSYLVHDLPPSRFVTSVRAIVFRGENVLLLRNADGEHIIPGGRCESGESFEATLQRELREETGWSVVQPDLLAVLHFHATGERPDGYRYPFPDFVQLIYTAEADEEQPSARDEYDYEREATWIALDAVALRAESIGGGQLLDAARQQRARGRG